MHKSFTVALSKLLIESLFNDYNDNYDYLRFGPDNGPKEDPSLKSSVRNALNKRKYFYVDSPVAYALQSIDSSSNLIEYFEYLYNLLEDDYSRNLLIKVCAFRILGNRKVKLPMNNPEYWKKTKEIDLTCADKNDFLQTSFLGHKLYKYNLQSIGYPISLYFNSVGIYFDYIYKGYNYKTDNINISVEEEDHVIDAGGCYGDTALFFAYQAGKNGKVFTFEFVPENVNILTENLKLNPTVNQRITLVQNPLWSSEGVPVYFEANGPGTRVSMSRISDKSLSVPTTTIDKLVSEKNIPKVDFIKMDIEGAEIEALKGAEDTLKKFKPKLAISLYHSPIDFKRIPEYLKSLNLGYKFYFNHYTMHAEESVLFCKV